MMQADPNSVDCPHPLCKQPPGHPCIFEDGHPRKFPHKERYKAAANKDYGSFKTNVIRTPDGGVSNEDRLKEEKRAKAAELMAAMKVWYDQWGGSAGQQYPTVNRLARAIEAAGVVTEKNTREDSPWREDEPDRQKENWQSDGLV